MRRYQNSSLAEARLHGSRWDSHFIFRSCARASLLSVRSADKLIIIFGVLQCRSRHTPWNERWIGEKIASIDADEAPDHVTFTYEWKVKTLEFRTNLRKQCNFFRHKTMRYDWMRCETTQSTNWAKKFTDKLFDEN